MPPRSCSIWRITWRKLSFSLPTRLKPGTCTSSNSTSQKWSLPVMSSMVRTVMPGDDMSTISSLSPAWRGASGSVRAMQ